MSKESAFLNYYNDKGIIPVSQPVNDRHFLRRSYLYSTLGINLSSISNSKVIEFGPGGGFNAEAICRWNPARYTLVDASTESLNILRNKRDSGKFGDSGGGESIVNIVDSTILTFTSDQLFDLVIVEGLVPCQTHPEEILLHTSSFTELGGVFTTTTTSATSLLSETCRKVFLPHIKKISGGFDEQVNFAADIFDSHLKSLGNDLRPARDWVLDSILHEMYRENKCIWTMVDVIETLGQDFQFQGSSPRFLMDDRFYKHIGLNNYGNNQLLLEQFAKINLSFLDCSVSMSDCNGLDASLCRDIEILCADAWDIHLDICNKSNYQELDRFLQCMNNIRNLLPPGFESTGYAIDDFRENFPRFLDSSDNSVFTSFMSWWGRGQQYISMTRNPLQ